MAEEDEIISLAEQILGNHNAKSDSLGTKPSEPQAPEITVEPERADAPVSKETKTAAELAKMIEADLA